MSDHMLEVDWTKENGWTAPEIKPFQNLSLNPASMCLHYGLECFEGLKAYIDPEGHARLFRPDRNMARMNTSLARMGLPEFDAEEFIKCMKDLVVLDKKWIPNKDGYSLYLRPTGLGTQSTLGVGCSEAMKLFVITSPVGPYFKDGFKAVSLLASTTYARAWPGGTGCYKLGGNYAMTIMPQVEANQQGFAQILWLQGEEHNVTEVGTMNMMVYWINKEGEKELITAPLDGIILPGVTRDSVLQMTRKWGDFKVTEKVFTMKDLAEAIEEGRVIEAFGCGTACIVTPIKNINYQGVDYAVPLNPKKPESQAGELTERLLNAIQDVQYGREQFVGDDGVEWSVKLD
eukprot:TRINITY_DN1853_c0_g1_i2.p1 TRINITY_DN1853_c0_g1~~TRINITY_DN1853_c0_g1_i2.p1  ORF type:complete len:405 (-),score=164.19 TRINITY_DN1853_c0_g1_i2:52-1086(-)